MFAGILGGTVVLFALFLSPAVAEGDCTRFLPLPLIKDLTVTDLSSAFGADVLDWTEAQLSDGQDELLACASSIPAFANIENEADYRHVLDEKMTWIRVNVPQLRYERDAKIATDAKAANDAILAERKQQDRAKTEVYRKSLKCDRFAVVSTMSPLKLDELNQAFGSDMLDWTEEEIAIGRDQLLACAKSIPAFANILDETYYDDYLDEHLALMLDYFPHWRAERSAKVAAAREAKAGAALAEQRQQALIEQAAKVAEAEKARAAEELERKRLADIAAEAKRRQDAIDTADPAKIAQKKEAEAKAQAELERAQELAEQRAAEERAERQLREENRKLIAERDKARGDFAQFSTFYHIAKVCSDNGLAFSAGDADTFLEKVRAAKDKAELDQPKIDTMWAAIIAQPLAEQDCYDTYTWLTTYAQGTEFALRAPPAPF